MEGSLSRSRGTDEERLSFNGSSGTPRPPPPPPASYTRLVYVSSCLHAGASACTRAQCVVYGGCACVCAGG